MTAEKPRQINLADRGESSDEEINALRARGEHAAAAALLRQIGRAAEAAVLYERLFDDERALEAFDAADDVLGALRVATRRGADEEVRRRLPLVIHRSLVGPAKTLLERSAKHAALAWLCEATGELEAAARHYRLAGQPMESARVLEQCGRTREAGEEYENALKLDRENADAHLRLGRLLARFSRYEDAIAHLQQAIGLARDPDEMLCVASSVLILSFTGLGYRTAAQFAFARWRDAASRRDETVPSTLDTFLQSEPATAFVALLRDTSTEELTFHDGTAGQARPTDQAEASARAPGEVLLSGRYLLGEAIGGGGVGQVFRSFDALLERRVAVKVFGANASGSEAIRTYALELRAVSSLQIPSIASLVEINLPSGYLVTEWIDGRSVAEALREGGAAGWVAAMGHAVLDTLAATHRAGLVHGALKPTNILLLPAGGVKLVDFGAHHLYGLRSTETGGLANSWAYLSPAQLLGRKASVHDDLYAVAAVLYRVITGRPPFLAVGDDRNAAPPAPTSLQPHLPEAWDDFLSRALSATPENRFADARSMAAALPALPPTFVLPDVPAIAAKRESPEREVRTRYRLAGEALTGAGHPLTYEGVDDSLERPVWVIETDDPASLDAFLVCARIPRGVQPVYDVVPVERRAILARDAAAPHFPLRRWREVPQHLVRDLAAVAEALEQLHDAGYAIGGFPIERALGPFGPRLRLAPAPLPTALTPTAAARDDESFARLIENVFDLVQSDAATALRRLIEHLTGSAAIEEEGSKKLLSSMNSGERTSVLLRELSATLVTSARGRVMSRLAANILRDSSGEG